MTFNMQYTGLIDKLKKLIKLITNYRIGRLILLPLILLRNQKNKYEQRALYKILLRNTSNVKVTKDRKYNKILTNYALINNYKQEYEYITNKNERIKELRIAYFIWHFPVPSETFVLNELRYLVEKGIDVIVFCRQTPFKNFKPDFPIQYKQVDTPSNLAKELKNNNRNIVHSHFTYPTVTKFTFPACVEAQIQFTFIAHSQDIFRYENIKNNRIADIVSSEWCLKVFVPGKYHHAFLAKHRVPANKILINSQGIEYGIYEKKITISKLLKKKHYNLCTVNRFVEKKGIEYLIKAAKILKNDEITINIYGYGPLQEKYEKIIKEEKLTNVNILGQIEGKKALQQVFIENDLFILPSIQAKNGDMDGIPTVLMEAMASGIPILTTGISSIPDLVQDGLTGYLTKTKDTLSLVNTINEFINEKPERKKYILQNAQNHVRNNYCINNSMRILKRIWKNYTVDIIIVSHNNLAELKEVITRVYEYTTIEFNLIVVDNKSNNNVVHYLTGLDQLLINMTFVSLDRNIFVGPATNIALHNSKSRYAIYICAKEGFVTGYNWENKMINYMEEHEQVGIAGTLGYSPSYYDGRGYVKNHPNFNNFRNKQYAFNNLDRSFKHVQGGLFILRRKMYEEIGGFSESVPHDGTDVEYSYYAESKGWVLGNITSMLSIYHKSLPSLDARINEKILAVHPLTLQNAKHYKRIVDSDQKLCNICSWSGKVFKLNKNKKSICPNCGSSNSERTLYKYLSGSDLTYRGLKCLDLNYSKPLAQLFYRMFEYERVMGKVKEVEDKFLTVNKITKKNSIDLVIASGVLELIDNSIRLLEKINYVLKPGGKLLVQTSTPDISCTKNINISHHDYNSLFKSAGFVTEQIYLASTVNEFDWLPLYCCHKDKGNHT